MAIITGLLDQQGDDFHHWRRTESEAILKDRAETGTPVPTNGEIGWACRTMAHQHLSALDAGLFWGRDFIWRPEGKQAAGDFLRYDWNTKEANPIIPAARRAYESPSIQEVRKAANADGGIETVALGMSQTVQAVAGEEGGAGIAFGRNTKGYVFSAGKLGLEIDVSVNLQVGLWAASPEGLSGLFYGIEVALDLGVGVTFGVYVTKEFRFYGASFGFGAGLGEGASIVCGGTVVF